MTRLGWFARKHVGSHRSLLLSSLVAQVDAASAAAHLALDVAHGRLASSEARIAVSHIEHEGDDHRCRLVEVLDRSLVTPFDREDLFRLSRSIDDVLDNLRDFVREYDLLRSPEGTPLVPVLAAIVESVHRLRAAVERMLDKPAGLTQGALAAKKGGNGVRQEYQAAVADLLNDAPIDRELLKSRELLRRLDVVGLRLGEAADALADGAMKRSH